jgi:hypothetical protein
MPRFDDRYVSDPRFRLFIDLLASEGGMAALGAVAGKPFSVGGLEVCPYRPM